MSSGETLSDYWRPVGNRYAPVFYAAGNENERVLHHPSKMAQTLVLAVGPAITQRVTPDGLARALWRHAIDRAFNLFNDSGVVTPFGTWTEPEIVVNMFAEIEALKADDPRRRLLTQRHMVGIAFSEALHMSPTLNQEVKARASKRELAAAEGGEDSTVVFVSAGLARDTQVRLIADQEDSATPGYEFIARLGTDETDAEAADRYDTLLKAADRAQIRGLRCVIRKARRYEDIRVYGQAVLEGLGQVCLGSIHGLGLALAASDDPLSRSRARL